MQQAEHPQSQGVVMIVDDVPDNLALLSGALDQAAGYMVLVALDGSSALERMQRLKPDIVLLDAMMPGLDGFETPENQGPAYAGRRSGAVHDGADRKRARTRGFSRLEASTT